MIKVENLTFSYFPNKEACIHDLSFEIREGTINVLLGLNGCGKTTLIKLLVNILKTRQGYIYIDGKNIDDYSIKELSQQIAYVPQNKFIIDDFIVRDYLSFSFVNTTRFYQKPDSEKYNKIERYAKLFRIDKLLDSKLNKISGGERQLVLICSAVLQNTKIIILDEPTSALDLGNQALILNALKRICKNENKTVLLSDHNPNHALFLDSTVFVMKKGMIVNHGKAKEVIKKDCLCEIYGEDICTSRELPYDEISVCQTEKECR